MNTTDCVSLVRNSSRYNTHQDYDLPKDVARLQDNNMARSGEAPNLMHLY